jgi:hypothetical protein
MDDIDRRRAEGSALFLEACERLAADGELAQELPGGVLAGTGESDSALWASSIGTWCLNLVRRRGGCLALVLPASVWMRQEIRVRHSAPRLQANPRGSSAQRT